MTVENDHTLRSLLQILGPARALREDVEKAINLELYEGTGGFIANSFRALQQNVSKLTNDAYVETLSQNISDSAGDKEKFAMVLFALGQLIAYIEGQAGYVGAERRAQGQTIYNVQRQPFSIGSLNIKGGEPKELEKVIEMLKAVHSEAES